MADVGAGQCVAPESVPAMAKARGALSLRQARAYAASLPAGEHSMGGCYTHRCVGCGCDGACVGCSYNADCGGTGCVLTSYSLFVPLCCTPLRAADSHRPAEWVNLKGDMRMVTVDGEKGTLACFGAVRENSTTCCYCERAGS